MSYEPLEQSDIAKPPVGAGLSGLDVDGGFDRPKHHTIAVITEAIIVAERYRIELVNGKPIENLTARPMADLVTAMIAGASLFDKVSK
jgi:hypothetical protein